MNSQFILFSLFLILIPLSIIMFFVNAERQPMETDDDESPTTVIINGDEEQEKQNLLRENVAIHRARIESEYDDSPIDIIDYNFLPGFDVLKEMDQYKSQGIRAMKFGASHQTAVATKIRPPPPSWPDRVTPTNSSFPLQPVDWNARPVFRYSHIVAQSVLFYEIRAEKKKKNAQKVFLQDEELPLSSVERVLLVGLGGGSVIKALEKMIIPSSSSPSSSTTNFFKRVDIVEIDRSVISAAEQFFDFKNSTAPQNYNIIHGDAYEVLNREEFKKNEEMKYDLIILDCASSGSTFNEDISYPLRAKGINMVPEVSQSLSCFKPSFLKLLPAFYLRDPDVSVVVSNFLGFLEPIHSMTQKPALRVLKTFKTAFQRDTRPIVQPAYLRKWKNGFRPHESGHRNAKVFDNLIIFATWKNSYEPSVKDMLDKVKAEVNNNTNANEAGDYSKSRFYRIAEEELFTDLIKNRYERQMSEMEDDVVILPRTERKKPTIKVKELPDFYVPLKERDSEDRKKMKGTIWHDY